MKEAPTIALDTSAKPAAALSTTTWTLLNELPSFNSIKQNSF